MKPNMLKLRLIKFCFLLFVFCAICTSSNNYAQTKICDLRISVFEYIQEATSSPGVYTLRQDETNALGEAKAALTNTKTKKIIPSILVDRVPYFRNLEEGTYEIIVSKPGYKKTKEVISHGCNNVDDDNKFCTGIFLHQGDINEFYLPRRLNVKTILGDPEPGGECYLSLPPQISKIVSGGVVNSKALNFVKPPYPPAARAVRASGVVNVQVTIDENGDVVSASAVSGHPLLREASEKAARASKFSPTLLEGQPVKVTGVIIYNFVP